MTHHCHIIAPTPGNIQQCEVIIICSDRMAKPNNGTVFRGINCINYKNELCFIIPSLPQCGPLCSVAILHHGLNSVQL